jgi:hypothetical protein
MKASDSSYRTHMINTFKLTHKWSTDLHYWITVTFYKFNFTHSLTELGHSWKAANCAAIRNFPPFYGTR